MQCVTECPATKVGRKGAALQKFFYEGDDSIWTRLTAKNNYVAGDPNDYRFTIRFDKAGFLFLFLLITKNKLKPNLSKNVQKLS